jgi:hypothetical protein
MLLRLRLALALTLVGIVLWVGLYLRSRALHTAPLHAALPTLFVPPPTLRHESLSPAVFRMQAQPLYKQAEAACRHKQFHEGVRLLEKLAASPGLSSEEAAFVRAQQAICRKDAGDRPVPVSASSSPPKPAPVSGADCGPRALALVCQRLGVSASVSQLRRAAGTTEKGTSLAGLAKAAEALGLKAEGVQVSREGLGNVTWPALAWVNERHYIAVLSRQGEGERATVTVHDPNVPQEETLPTEKLLQRCGGYLLLVHQ